eukprot:gb/GEZN01001353.1/.p1 GENE.gb/GEZN01001353.1/~~gb/GEZN01001353.1/.p1  ORF type:complete len:692 (-),score=86.21 gb/GEZN01001353.1/:570-2645(-)
MLLVALGLLRSIDAYAGSLNLTELSAFVEGILQCGKVPGMGVTVVQDGQVLVAESYGQMRPGDVLGGDADTLWAMGSTSKSFTSLLMANLASEGKLSSGFDTKIREILPAFRLADRVAQDKLTVRDILSHRSGLPAHEGALFHPRNVGRPRSEIMQDLTYLEPNEDMRTKFQYNNYMYILAGYIEEVLTNHSWEQLVESEIFNRLGMNHSKTGFFAADDVSNKAHPMSYDATTDTWKDLWAYNRDVMSVAGPAGTLMCSPKDVAEYLKYMLRPEAFPTMPAWSSYKEELWTATMLTGDPHSYSSAATKAYSQYTEMNSGSAYGLGWFLGKWKGRPRVFHSGGVFHASSLLSLLPFENVAVGVWISAESEALPLKDTLTWYVLDHLLSPQPDMQTPVDGCSYYCKALGFGCSSSRRRTTLKDPLSQPTRHHTPTYSSSISSTSSFSKPERRTLLQTAGDSTVFSDYIKGFFFHPSYGNLSFNLRQQNKTNPATNETMTTSTLVARLQDSFDLIMEYKKPDTFHATQDPLAVNQSIIFSEALIIFQRTAFASNQGEVSKLTLRYHDEFSTIYYLEFTHSTNYRAEADSGSCSFPLVNKPSVYVTAMAQQGPPGLTGVQGPPGADGKDGTDGGAAALSGGAIAGIVIAAVIFSSSLGAFGAMLYQSCNKAHAVAAAHGAATVEAQDFSSGRGRA